MSTTNQEKQEYLEKRRYFYSVTPTYYGNGNFTERKKKEAEQEKRTKTLLKYLNEAKKSAIKRGMYNQKPYQTVVSEAEKNV